MAIAPGSPRWAESDRLAELHCSIDQRHGVHDVNHRNDLEIVPRRELGDFSQQASWVISLDDRYATLAVHPPQELQEVLISLNTVSSRSMRTSPYLSCFQLQGPFGGSGSWAIADG
jgi:hypothetical protein